MQFAVEMGNETEMLIKEHVASSCFDIPIVPILVFSIILVVLFSALCYRNGIFERCANATVKRQKESEEGGVVSREFKVYIFNIVKL